MASEVSGVRWETAMPLRLEQEKITVLRSCFPHIAQRTTIPSCEVCSFHERLSKRRVVEERGK